MTGLLDSRIALITGAGSGIGEAIACAMAGAGARVIAVDIAAAAHGAGARRQCRELRLSVTAPNAMRSPPRCGVTSVRFRSWSTTPGSFAVARSASRCPRRLGCDPRGQSDRSLQHGHRVSRPVARNQGGGDQISARSNPLSPCPTRPPTRPRKVGCGC